MGSKFDSYDNALAECEDRQSSGDYLIVKLSSYRIGVTAFMVWNTRTS